MPDTPPQRIGRYEVLAELGQGAMGLVYEAHDPQLGRAVAIKTLRRDLGVPPEEYEDLRKRFHQEAQAAGRLSHRNIVIVHDVVEIDAVPYMVMELLEGRTLADVIATRGRLAPEEAIALLGQVCEALDYAHSHGVVHRDIKPGNIVVAPDGVAKITDFGIARLAGSSVTRTGVLVGTPAYMSPEQLRGRVPDGRSDLFSLGVVLYEALTGVNPFRREELAATLYQVVEGDPGPMRERNPAVPPGLEGVTARALAKRPEDRYPTARALAEALRGALAGEGGIRHARPAPPPRRATARRRRAVAAVIVGGAVVGALAGWARWGGDAGDEVAAGRGNPGAAGTSAFAVPWTRPAEVGEIVVATNPAVEVFLDGELRGRTGGEPLTIARVPAGERLVTLRLGGRAHEVRATVRTGETLEVRHRFAAASTDVPLDELLGATRNKILDAAREKLREVPVLRDLAGQPERRRPGTPKDGQ